jgi:hypothetical protein
LSASFTGVPTAVLIFVFPVCSAFMLAVARHAVNS